jgi:hypothetical protein
MKHASDLLKFAISLPMPDTALCIKSTQPVPQFDPDVEPAKLLRATAWR